MWNNSGNITANSEKKYNVMAMILPDYGFKFCNCVYLFRFNRKLENIHNIYPRSVSMCFGPRLFISTVTVNDHSVCSVPLSSPLQVSESLVGHHL